MRTIDSIIYDVGNSLSGAPMGRRNVGYKPTDGTKVYDCNVPINKGGYDRGGAYWGYIGGKPLRVKYTKDLSYIEFYRVAN